MLYKGSEWTHVTPPNPVYTAGAGINIAGNVVTNTGDTNGGDDVNDGDAFGGDVSGTFNNVSVNKLKGKNINGNPTNGQIMQYNGSEWTHVTPPNAVYTAGTGISIAGNVVTNTGDTNANDDVNNNDNFDGDVSGTYGNISVNRIRGKNVASTGPTEGQILKFTGGSWTPSDQPPAPAVYSGAVGAGGAVLFANGMNVNASGDNIQISITGVTLTASNNALVVTSRTTAKTYAITYSGGNAIISATSGAAYPCSFILTQ
jgi:hypothetical protein